MSMLELENLQLSVVL